METNQLLKITINIFFYVILFSVLGLSLFTSYAMISHDGVGILIDKDSNVVLNSAYEADLTFRDYMHVLIAILEAMFFTLSIYFLRKATLEMVDGRIFTKLVANSLRNTGFMMIIYKLCGIIKEQYKNIVYDSQFTMSFDFNGFESFIFIFVLGLFFILLSSVINNGIRMKSENDLTI